MSNIKLSVTVLLHGCEASTVKATVNPASPTRGKRTSKQVRRTVGLKPYYRSSWVSSALTGIGMDPEDICKLY